MDSFVDHCYYNQTDILFDSFSECSVDKNPNFNMETTCVHFEYCVFVHSINIKLRNRKIKNYIIPTSLL